jgi:predicted ATPase
VVCCVFLGLGFFCQSELCSAPLGPADYLAIARQYHTVFVDDIPELNMQRRNEARRFISLVDALYECNTNIYCNAEHAPDAMFVDVSAITLAHDSHLRSMRF